MKRPKVDGYEGKLRCRLPTHPNKRCIEHNVLFDQLGKPQWRLVSAIWQADQQIEFRQCVFASRSRNHTHDVLPAACASNVFGNGARIMDWSNHTLLPCPSAPIPKH